MTANPDPVHPGDRIVYTLTVSNLGNSTLTGVTLTDLVPNNTTVRAPRHLEPRAMCVRTGLSGRHDAQLGPWQPRAGRGAEQFSSPRWLIPKTRRQSRRSIHNSAAVLTNELSAANASHDVVVANVGGLVLALEDDPDPVTPGALLTYSLTFGNPGAGTVPATVLSAQLPPGTTFVGANGGGALSAGLVQWAIGPLAAGSTGQRQFTVMVNPLIQNGSTAETSAEIRDAATAQSLARATAVTVVRSNPQLALSMLANPDPVQPGDRVVYTLTVSNVGASTLANVTLTDLVPNNTTVARLDISTPGLCAFAQICPRGNGAELGAWQSGAGSEPDRTVHRGRRHRQCSRPRHRHSRHCIRHCRRNDRRQRKPRHPRGDGERRRARSHGRPRSRGAGRHDHVHADIRESRQQHSDCRGADGDGTFRYTFVSANGGGAVAGGAVQWSLGTLAPASTGQRQFTVTVAGGAANGSSV
jgi:uncharacterized repeat protein (TIGR01451 family)